MKIITNQLQSLSDRVYRLTAPNPGMMTGPGTNTYIVKLSQRQAIVIDPGPAMTQHVNNIQHALTSINCALSWILCTHSHLDHSPAAKPLQALCGGIIVGQLAQHNDHQDPSFSPDECWQHDHVLQGSNTTLRAIHTPGHASNHLCFYLEEEQLLFTGDHIMEGSTVVISPPDGNMLQYLASLKLLMGYPLKQLAPAHGELIQQPIPTIEKLVKHRLQREAKVIRKLRQLGPIDVASLTSQVYDDVPMFLHPVAQRSLQAHLEKLQYEKLATKELHQWRWLPSQN